MKQQIKRISKRVDDYLSDKNNRLKLAKKRPNAFLDMQRLKFPVIDPFTLKYDCSLIYKSYSHASYWSKKGSKELKPEYYRLIMLKAEQLLIENNCNYNKVSL